MTIGITRVYSLADFDRIFASRRAAGAAVEPLGAEILSPSVSLETRALIRDGDDLEHPIGSVRATFPSRSEAVFRVAIELARAGETEETIAGILLNPAHGISASVLAKSKSVAYALRQARRAYAQVLEGWPNVDTQGRPRPTLANTLIAVLRLGLTFEFDEFQNRKRINGQVLQEMTGELSDDLCAAIRNEILRRWKFDPGKEHVRDAALTHCLDNRVHPIREYLDPLRWDGVPRLDRWLTTYLGAEATPFHAAVGRLVLMAAVRRVRQPGAKFDSILVLEGVQGSGKSTAILILAGERYFSDQEILTLDTKAQMEAVEGIWLYELGELQGMQKADTDRVKAFASRRVDRARAAYARFREDRPRQTIFIGTTNDRQYLRDPTGNRRFWPVETGSIDLVALARDRDQLWAEASQSEAQGTPLTLPEDLWPLAAEVQDARLLDDPWLDQLAALTGTVEGETAKIATNELLEALEVPGDRRNQASAKRLAPLMAKLGWAGPKTLRIQGRVCRGYERPAPGAMDSPNFTDAF